MKKLIALIMAALMLFALAGCGEDSSSDYDYIVKKGTLIVGITDYAPMDYKDDKGEWTGFDAEFARLVADKMDVKVEFIEIDWDNKFFELKSKAIDCIWNGMTISTEVKKNTSVSKAYVQNKQIVVMAADKIAEYPDIESMKNLKFAVEAGSAGETAAKDNKLDYTAVSAQSDALLEVASGSADACIIDSTMAESMTGEGTNYASFAPGLSLTDEEYGIGFRIGSDMTAKINTYIDELKADGTLTALAKKYKLELAD